MTISRRIFLPFLIAIVLCTGITPMQGTQIAWAIEESGSKVLVDLCKAENFNIDDYPYNPTDYSLQVIQVAESTENELLLYVYQPTGASEDLRATSISMSIVAGRDIVPRIYQLEFLNSSGVFYKYKVKDFVVSSATTRVYSIVSIYRPFISGVDKATGNNNTINEVVYAVAKEFTFYTGKDNYEMQVLDVVEITDKFVGYVIVSEGVDYGIKNYTVKYCSHVVAFSCDKKIDQLLEADVYYKYQSYSHTHLYDGIFAINPTDTTTFGQKHSTVVTLTSKDKLTYSGEGLWWAESVVEDRIQTTSAFIASTNATKNVYSGTILDVSTASVLTESSMQALKNKQWVLRFAETEERNWVDINSGAYEYYSTLIGGVSILRLKFITDDETYNLGIVDNKQTGGDEPMNDFYYDMDFHLPEDEDVKNALAIIALILVIVILGVVWFYLSQFLAPLKIPLKKLSAMRKKARKHRREARKQRKEELKELKEQEEIEKMKGD